MSKPLSDIEERLIWKPEEFLRGLKGTVVAKVRYALTVGKHLHVQISKSNPERNAIIDAADSMRTRVSTALIRTVEAVKDGI